MAQKTGIDRVRLAAVLLTVAGLALTLALIVQVGAGDVFAVVLRIGPAGFIGYCGVTLVILAVLGLAWSVLAPGRLDAFIWGRMAREAATDVLPFSQFGGIVVGARAVASRGVPATTVYASLIADQTAELAAQLVYTLGSVTALALLLSHAPADRHLLVLVSVGMAVSIAVMIAFTIGQRPLLMFGARIGSAVLPGSVAALTEVRDTLDAIYRRRGALIASFLLHIVTWVGSGAGAWIALTLIGIDLPVGSVIIIEGLIFTLRTAAFVIPGAIGLQEGAYVLIGPLFGLPAEAALALSLLKRARDLAIGVPIIVAWQIGEARAALRGTKAASG